MTDAERMMDLFAGSDLAHGRSEMLKTITSKGKHETKSWTEKSPAGLPEWELHVRGERGIGIMPLNSENRVRWGAIDVDVYDGLSIEEVQQRITSHKLPLVLCRSKSGGPHIYLFLRDWVPASAMIEKMESIASFFGFGDSEIFPKQAMICQDDKHSDFGNWINMPYFGGIKFLRYALDEKGMALPNIEKFYEYVSERRMSAAEFESLKMPLPEKEALPEGPPCLNLMVERGVIEGSRNIFIANVCVWAKKYKPENWKPEVDRVNLLLKEPLGSTEVERIKESYSKKDYRFQCSKPPLCSYCDSSACKRKKCGIGGQELLPDIRSLTKVDTNPPVWYLDIPMPDGSSRRMSLTTEQLQNPRLFQRRTMEIIHRMPPIPKPEDWQPVVEQLLSHVTVIEIPPELTPEGMAVELIWEFLHNRVNRTAEETMDDVLRGIPFKNNEGYFFRMRDLMQHLSSQRFIQLKQQDVAEIIRSRMGGLTGRFTKIKGKGVNLVQIPCMEEQQDQQEPFDKPNERQHF